MSITIRAVIKIPPRVICFEIVKHRKVFAMNKK